MVPSQFCLYKSDKDVKLLSLKLTKKLKKLFAGLVIFITPNESPAIIMWFITYLEQDNSLTFSWRFHLNSPSKDQASSGDKEKRHVKFLAGSSPLTVFCSHPKLTLPDKSLCPTSTLNLCPLKFSLKK